MNDTTDLRGMSAVKLALLAQQVRERATDLEVLAAEPVAIIGMGCRYPGGANSPETFWQLLRDGVDAVRPVPADRWDGDKWYDADLGTPGRMNTRWGGFIDAVDEFDAAYFGISRREASRMDPQQRIFLQVAIEALERAGQTAENLAGSQTGVFAATTMYDYSDRQFIDRDAVDAYSLTGNVHCIVANRLSFLLNLRGPSIALDTACSSSLVAVDLACRHLRDRDVNMAIAGGVNIILSPEHTLAMAKWGVMAADGRCKTFDAAADGFVRGEGCGIVVLKRLADAIADNDPIVAVIRGSAVNQDGRSTTMSAPNGLAQQDVIRRALSRSRIDASEVGCIEAHGTGTALGDPIEVEALAAVFGPPTPGVAPVALTAVKPNIGHSEAAAGVAGLIKLALCLQHETIPGVLHYARLNPHLSLEGTRLYVPASAVPWPAGDRRRIGGVSSFGFGGTNAHVVLEEAPRLPVGGPIHQPAVLLIASAKTQPALRETAERLADHLDTVDDADLPAVCATAALRRTHHMERLAVAGASAADLAHDLRSFASDRRSRVSAGQAEPGRRRRVAFICSGQGPQWWAMGRELLATDPTFRSVIEGCHELLRDHVDWSLLDELGADEAHSRLDETAIAQPAIFAVQVALAAVWRRWGVTPDVVIGHSVGEVAAAHLSGALTLEDAVRVVALRGRLMQPAAGQGAMASVDRSRAEVEAIIAPSRGLEIAAVNAPSATVISGDTDALAEAIAALRATGATVRQLPVDYAFHSHQMDAAAAQLARSLADVVAADGPVRFVSTVTAALEDGRRLDGTYWADNVRRTVRFAEAVEAALAEGCDVFVELAPHPVLGGAINEVVSAHAHQAVTVASLRRHRPELETMLQALGELHCNGVPVDWSAVWPGRQPIASLPTYPWQNERHWVDAAPRSGRPERRAAGSAWRNVRAAGVEGAILEMDVSADAPPYLADHRIGDTILLPATAFVDLAASALAAATGRSATVVEDVDLRVPLTLGEDEPMTVQVQLTGDGDSTRFTVSSASDDGRTIHATGRLTVADVAGTARRDVVATKERCGSVTGADDVYRALTGRGIAFGPSFRRLAAVWAGDGEAVGELVVPADTIEDASSHWWHPALLDAALQPVASLLPPGSDPYLPVVIEAVHRFGPPVAEMWSVVTLRSATNGRVVADVVVVDASGIPLIEVAGLHVVRTSINAVRDTEGLDALYRIDWQAAPEPRPRPGAARWLVVGGPLELVAELVTSAEASGIDITVVREPDVATATIDELIARIGPTDIVFLGGLDIPPLERGADAVAAQPPVLSAAAAVVRSIIGTSIRAWLVTAGAQAVDAPPVAPEQATLWGFGAAAVAEHPELSCARVDLDPSTERAGGAVELATVVLGSDGDEMVAVRGGIHFVGRLVPARRDRSVAQEGPTRLVSGHPGVLDGLRYEVLERRPPGPGEVEIAVEATGLNFRDVLIALDLYPEHVEVLGEECAGEVVRVGSGVDELKPGDRVVAMASGAFATHVTTQADFVARLPDSVALVDAATMPITTLTALYALEQLGRLSTGERVLIHAGAGGVGMAAVQVAHRAGAEIFATAGTPEKRAVLEALGVRYVFDSRSLSFADDVMAATDGAGVDVVLNSLTGGFIARSLDVVAPGGRFLEIGRRDVWTPEQVAAVRPDVEYHVVFLGDLLVADPPSVKRMLSAVMTALASGELRPLPATTFAASDVVDAFRYMAQARHVGKIVVTRRTTSSGVTIRPDATYLVTGGLGGIGIELARWLVANGARHLTLVGRRAAGEAALTTVAEMRAMGAEIVVVQGDVSRRDDMERALHTMRATMPPLAGLVHAAGVNDDAVVADLTADHFASVLTPKVGGAWLLDELTAGEPLDLFVVVSSASAVLGGPAQANYAAANAFLDAFAARRSLAGRTVSIGWGPWDGVGMTARLDGPDRSRMARRGIAPLGKDRALATFGGALESGLPHVLAAELDPTMVEDRSFLRTVRRAGTKATALVDEWVATVPALRRAAIAAFVTSQAVEILGLPANAVIPPRQPFQELGLDSLMAVELRNAIGAALGTPQPPTLLFDHPTTDALCDHLVLLVDAAVATPAAGAPAPSAPTADVAYDDLADLSEAEAELLLLAELGDPGRVS